MKSKKILFSVKANYAQSQSYHCYIKYVCLKYSLPHLCFFFLDCVMFHVLLRSFIFYLCLGNRISIQSNVYRKTSENVCLLILFLYCYFKFELSVKSVEWTNGTVRKQFRDLKSKLCKLYLYPIRYIFNILRGNCIE